MKQPSSSFLTPDSIFFLPSLLLLVPCVCSDNDLFIPNKSIRCISLVPPPLPSKCHHSISQTSPSSLCSLQVVYRQAALLYPFPSAFTPCPPWLPHSPLFLPSPLHSPLLFIQWTSTRSLSMPRTKNAFIYSTTTTFSISLSLSRHSFPLGLHWSFSTLSSTKNGTMLSNEPFSYPILQSLMFNSCCFVSFVAKQNTDNI